MYPEPDLVDEVVPLGVVIISVGGTSGCRRTSAGGSHC